MVGLVLGFIVGILGAILWGVLAYYGNIEIGWLAWGIGAAVGFAVSLGSKYGGFVPAVAAVVITVASICGGKYLMSQLAMVKFDKAVASIPELNSDDDLLRTLAYKKAESLQRSGQPVQWRNGATLDSIKGPEDYPPQLLIEVHQKIKAMTEQEKADEKARLNAELKKAIAKARQKTVHRVFVGSFGVMDIIFFLLGMYTAGQIAFSDVVGE